MRNKTLLLVIMAIHCMFLFGQQALNVKELKFETIDIVPSKQTLTKAIANIDVFDARPDSICLGFIDTKADGRKLSKDPLRDYLALTLSTNLQNAIGKSIILNYGLKRNGFNILLAIKELWLYDNDNSEITNNAMHTGPNTSGALFRADVYLERGSSFIPLFQIDSTFIVHTFLDRSKSILLQNAFNSLSNKLNDFPLLKAYEQATRVKSMVEIDSFYHHFQQLDLVKFTDSSRQYVFKTFADFKIGKYSNTILTKASDKLGDYYYEKGENGKESLVKGFAFVDKCQIFIKSNNTYSPIYIHSNRIYTFGSKFVVSGTSALPIYMPLGASGGYNYYAYSLNGIEIGNNSKRDYQLTMLDLQTGNCY